MLYAKMQMQKTATLLSCDLSAGSISYLALSQNGFNSMETSTKLL
jgi:hypothetical protein